MNKWIAQAITIIGLSSQLIAMKSVSEEQDTLITELFNLAISGTAPQLKAFLDEHPDVNVSTPSETVLKGYTALHWTCARGDKESSALLIEKGASLTAKASGNGQSTPLMLAAKIGSEAICRMILEKDHSIINSEQAIKAIRNAIIYGHADLVAFFIYEEVPCDYQELLCLAVKEGQQEIVDLFLIHGAKLHNPQRELLGPVLQNSGNQASTIQLGSDTTTERTQLGAEKTRYEPEQAAASYSMLCIKLYKTITDLCGCCKKHKHE